MSASSQAWLFGLALLAFVGSAAISLASRAWTFALVSVGLGLWVLVNLATAVKAA